MDIKVIASGSSGNCSLVSDGETALLLDAGIPFKRIQVGCGFRTSGIKGCLVTHRHGDHAKAIPKLVERGIRVYGPMELAALYRGVQGIDALRERAIGTFAVLPFRVEHDVECYGYQIESTATKEKLLYVTDTAYIRYTFHGLTHLMVEANYAQEIIMDNVRHEHISACLAERIVRSHMSIETLLGLLRANDMRQVRQVYLLHLSDDNSHAESFRRQVQEETGAEVYAH